MSDQVRGQLSGRPRQQWNAGGDPEVSDLQAWGRGASAVLALTNPLTAVLAWIAVVAANRVPVIRRLPAGRFFVGSIVVVLGVMALTKLKTYLAPWIDIWNAVKVAGSGHKMAAIADTAASHWPTWMLKQLPLAIVFAISIAFFVLWRRQRYRAEFRELEEMAKPEAVAAAVAATDGDRPPVVSEVADSAELMLRLGGDMQSGDVYQIEGRAVDLHAVVVGPSGYGKSTTLERLTWELLGAPGTERVRNSQIFIDMKADPPAVEYRRRLAAATGRQCHVITVDGRGATTTYNPLRHGTPPEIRNMLIRADEESQDGGTSEPYYRVVGQRWMLLVCVVLTDLVERGRKMRDGGGIRPWRRDLHDLVRLMQPDVLARMTSETSPAVTDRINSYFETASDELMHEINGIYQKWADVIEGALGPVVVDQPSGLDLYAAIKAGDVVVFSLDASGDTTAARQLGNLVLQDVVTTMSRLQAEEFAEAGRRCVLMVDEFSALGGSGLFNCFARARSAGVITVLASQSTEDFRAVSDQFDASVRTNGNVFILHRQKNDDADLWARAIGTQQGFQETLQVQDDVDLLGSQTAASGVGSLRIVDKFVIHPNEFKNLGQGEAVILAGWPTTTQRRVVVARAPRLPAVPPVNGGWLPAATPEPVTSGQSGAAQLPGLAKAEPPRPERWWTSSPTAVDEVEDGASPAEPAAAEQVPATAPQVAATPPQVAATGDDDEPGDDWHLRLREE